MIFHNPKNTKQEIKLWAFYLLDIALVGAMIFIASYVIKIVPMTGGMQIFYYIMSGLFGIFLCAKTPNHPTQRNILILLYLLRMDRNRYHTVDVKNYEHKRGDLL